MKELYKELDRIYKECSEPDWDCYDARPILKEAYNLSKEFIKKASSKIKKETIVPSPDGWMSFEFYKNRNTVLLISFGKKAKDAATEITYAFIDGNKKESGYLNFIDEAVKYLNKKWNRLK